MSILRTLFLVFVVLPILELVTLYQLGVRFGFFPTLLGVLLVGAVGASIAKREGMRAIAEWNRSLAEGTVPEDGVLSGVLSLAAAFLFVLPGVISDVLGIVLVLPPTRKLIARAIRERFERGVANGRVEFSSFGTYGSRGFSTGPRGPGSGAQRGFPAGERRTRDAGQIVDVVGEDVTDSRDAPRTLPASTEDDS